jgi:hypothetical protein
MMRWIDGARVTLR